MLNWVPGPTRPLRPGEGRWALRTFAALLVLGGVGLAVWTAVMWARKGWMPQMGWLFAWAAGIVAAGAGVFLLVRLVTRYF